MINETNRRRQRGEAFVLTVWFGIIGWNKRWWLRHLQTIDNRLGFTEHIARIARKAHQHANVIHRCFTSKNSDLLLKAYIKLRSSHARIHQPTVVTRTQKRYVAESVQRQFTKRIPGLAIMTYYSRLKNYISRVWSYESCEQTWHVYKILFSVIRTKSDKLF